VRPTILIVDDHEAFRAAARSLLEAEGFAMVGEAADGPRCARRGPNA
jgi:DNA-binding NarL/FixJ family response regulator